MDLQKAEIYQKLVVFLDANLDGSDTGLSVTFNLECSVSNFVCQRIDNFKDAFSL